MTRKLSKFFVFTISILLAELIQNYIIESLNFRNSRSPYLSTLIKMVITVAIYYPLVEYAEKIIEAIVTQFIQKSKEAANNRLMGLIFGFLVAMVILYAFFISQDYGINLIVQCRKWVTSLF